ncbi:hypothetical protein KAR91_07130 [Candidatus Pacearchaeota archaeon]|nr:hypothetical protein [Candidatus Pacearchaeota archaeon]
MIPKYRAWDKKYSLMKKVKSIEWYLGEIWSITLISEKIYHVYHSDDKEYHDDDINNLVLMQSLGRKDKAGVEIFAGDLFNCIYHRDGCVNHIFQVVYCEQSTGFRLKRIGGKCQQPFVSQTVADVSRYKMIGNIHANPELLER